MTETCAHVPASLGPHSFNDPDTDAAVPANVSSPSTLSVTGVFHGVVAVSGTATTAPTVIVGVIVLDATFEPEVTVRWAWVFSHVGVYPEVVPPVPSGAVPSASAMATNVHPFTARQLAVGSVVVVVVVVTDELIATVS